MNILLMILPLGLFAVQTGFKPERFVASGKFQLDAPVSQAFPMFEPIGEKRWAEGWEPLPVYPSNIQASEGTVFSTKAKGGQSIWTITRYEKGKLVEYNVVTPSHDATLIAVVCKPLGDSKTEVSVTYRITSLSEKGSQFGREHSAQFNALMLHWQDQISGALSKN